MNRGWQSVTLGDVFKVKHGYAFKGEFFTDARTNAVLLTPGNFAIGGGFQNHKPKYYAGPIPQDFVLTPGEVVVSMTDLSKQTDTLGLAAIIPDDGHTWLHNQRIGLLVFNAPRTVNAKFIHYLLRTHNYRSWVVGSATGTTVKHTAPARICSYSCSIPSLAEQDLIANILGSLDDMIELNRRMNETLEGIARAFFQSWFVDFDPVRAKLDGRTPYGMDQATADLFPDSFEDSSLGPIPKGWRVSKVTECCLRIHSGGTPSRNEPSYWENGSVPWLTSGEVRQPLITATNNFISELGLSKSSAKWVPSGSTVVALYGATAGQVAYLSVPVTTNQAVCALVPRPEFGLHNYFTMSGATDHMASKAVGSAQQNISKGIIEETDTVIPSRNILDAFDSLLRPLVQIWSGNIVRSCTLANLRDTLLPKLLSGELSVDEAGRCVEQAV